MGNDADSRSDHPGEGPIAGETKPSPCLADRQPLRACLPPAPLPTPLHRLRAATSGLSIRNDLLRIGGTVCEVGRNQFSVSGLGPHARLGDIVSLTHDGVECRGEIVRLQAAAATVKPFESLQNTRLGQTAWLSGHLSLKPDQSWKGRTIDAIGCPIDDLGPLAHGPDVYHCDAGPPPPMELRETPKSLLTGVRVIDVFTPLCSGQRIGVFAGSGVGKTSLLGMLAQGHNFDTIVLALVGERGREVRHFLEVFEAQLDKTVAVVASSAESAMMRQLAPQTAMAVAEYFRNRGENVLLVVDSLTRFAHAAREVGLAAGEAAVARGFPPSVFNGLAKLIERSGPGGVGRGTVTGIYSVLVDGDDHNEPVADNIRGTLDGHIVLDRQIAESGRYPAVNIQASISRLAHYSWTDEQRVLVMKLKSLVARYEDSRDLRAVGAYEAGADRELDEAVGIVPKLYSALSQEPGDTCLGNPFKELASRLT